VIDGVFEPASANGVVFHAATGVQATTVAWAQESVRQRQLRVFVRRGLLPGDAAQAMAQGEHGGGFSVDASVRIVVADRDGRERLAAPHPRSICSTSWLRWCRCRAFTTAIPVPVRTTAYGKSPRRP